MFDRFIDFCYAVHSAFQMLGDILRACVLNIFIRLVRYYLTEYGENYEKGITYTTYIWAKDRLHVTAKLYEIDKECAQIHWWLATDLG